jgi:ATP-binding protein involved in chromosome partitioning
MVFYSNQADIFGPSVPKMMNLNHEPLLNKDNQLIPLINYGVKCMSIGFLIPKDSAIVWRGLMLMKSIQQLLWEVDWSGIDILVIDLPPGTG